MKRKLRLLMTALMIVMALTVLCAVGEAQIVDSGQCGDNATWTLTEDNILRIEGTGAIWDCHDNSHGCSYCDGYFWNPDGLPEPCTAPDVLWRGNYDVESYVARISYGETADVCAAIMKLATSAKAYLLK